MKPMTRRSFLKLSGGALFCSSALTSYTFSASAAREPGQKIPVLLYHDLSDGIRDDYTLSPSSFAVQMEWLYANGYKTLSLAEVNGFIRGGAGQAVIITFDDGYVSFMDYAFPLLKEYGFKAFLYIIGRTVDEHMLLDKNRAVLSWDECRYLMNSGVVDFGCHSYDLHTKGGVLSASYPAIEYDFTRFQERYAKELGKVCASLASPYGIYDKRCIGIARKAGFTHLLTSREGFMEIDGILGEIPRLNMNHKLDLVSFQQYIGATV